MSFLRMDSLMKSSWTRSLETNDRLCKSNIFTRNLEQLYYNRDIRMYVYLCIYIYIYMSIYMPVYIYIYMYIHQIYSCEYIYIYIYIIIYICIYSYTYIHAYLHDLMNHVLIFEGQPRRFALWDLVPNWYKIFPPDNIDLAEMKEQTGLSIETSIQ